MRLFENSYHSVIRMAKAKYAPLYLSLLSFFESFILPFPPPDVMLAPMALARPARALSFAGLTLGASVIGGIAGYLIGAFLFEEAQPYILAWGYQDRFETVSLWFDRWGFWAVLVAGFSPIPYKIFTLSAGALGLSFLPFILASLVGRGARFYLLAWFLARYGAAIEHQLIRYIERIGWGILALLLVAIAVYSY